MGLKHLPPIVTDGLVFCVDAGNPKSYPGSGTVWYDLSGNGYNFNISASAYLTSGGISYMDFEGSYGIAKRVVGGALADVPAFTNATVFIFSEILGSGSDWRTLIRGATSDHQVIIQSGTNNLGMFDNATASFYDSSFDINSVPNFATKFNFMSWRLSQSSPYYQFQYNDDSTVYSITNANSIFNNGFCCIGGFHNSNTTVTNASQYWGKVAYFAYYSKHLSSVEIQQNFNALRSRFGV